HQDRHLVRRRLRQVDVEVLAAAVTPSVEAAEGAGPLIGPDAGALAPLVDRIADREAELLLLKLALQAGRERLVVAGDAQGVARRALLVAAAGGKGGEQAGRRAEECHARSEHRC